jgi:hypothetical protein
VATPYKVESLVQKIEIEYDGSHNPIFVGIAEPGSLTADPVWRVAQLNYSGSDLVEVVYADGTAESNHVWDDRAGYSYS